MALGASGRAAFCDLLAVDLTAWRHAGRAAIEAALARDLEPARELPHVRDVRVKGAIGVVELDRIDDLGALRFIEAGVFVRPIRNIVYLTPAFTIGEEDLNRLTGAAVSARL